MKVAIIYDLSEPGGVQSCVFSLIKGLNKINIKPCLFWDRAPNEALISELGIQLSYQKIRFNISSKLISKLPNSLRYLIRPFNFIRVSEIPISYDFVYSFTTNVNFNICRPHLVYLSGPPFLPQLESKSLNFKFIKFIYKHLLSPFYPAYSPQENVNYVINSIYTANLYNEMYKKNINVIYPPNQFNLDFSKKLDNRIYTTFYSRIVSYKRPEKILELAKKFPQEKFIIMGGVSSNQTNYFNRLRKDIIYKNINNILLYPNMSLEMVEKVLINSKYYIFPAVNEHFGITTVESIALGCIPLVHNSGGQCEIVPFKELRFTDADFIDKYHTLISMNNETLYEYSKTLTEHVKIFSEDEFIKKMLNYLVTRVVVTLIL
jgi:glycosyltransferase involved in cell wall biosynthesis